MIMTNIVALSSSHASDESKRIILPTNATPIHYQIDITPDAANFTFQGEVHIDLQVNETSNTIVLNAADLVFIEVDLLTIGKPTVTFDKVQQTAKLAFAKSFAPGKYTLSIKYKGVINKSAVGMFALDYTTNKQSKRALFTQFEAPDARRFVPCFDEPALKATFELSATIPSADYPVSNTPITSEESKTPGFKTVHFGRTPKMSTYLLFFSTGDFERVTKSVNNVEIGVVVKRGDTKKAQFALDAAVQILPFYEEYFGVKYPLPKMDMIAAPGQSQTFGAMENWGAILYFDRRLLIDDAISTQANRQDVYLVVAHEMAHQWFGNLVTMSWWDDLWLNEGFATWMETMVTDHFHPEWKIWMEAQNGKTGAMATDAKMGTHPIVQPILDILQAGQAFDNITYEKGSAVIRMFENYVGADEFRNGVRTYMKKYAYKNTVTDDLWREIDAASSRKISQIAHDFTMQAGVPQIEVASKNGQWHLSQARFAVDDSTPLDRKWHVPVNAAFLSKDKPWKGEVFKGSAISLPNKTDTGIYLDPNGGGYYRTRYNDEAFEFLVKNFKSLPSFVQLSLISDTSAQAFIGEVAISRVLLLLSETSVELDDLVLMKLIGLTNTIDYLYTDLPDQTRFRAFVQTRMKPVFNKLGWTSKSTDNANTPNLRDNLIIALGNVKDPDILKAANQYFVDFLKDPKVLPAELRSTVLAIVANNADKLQWQQIYDLALKAPSVAEQQEYYGLLTRSRNEENARSCLRVAQDKRTPETIRVSLLSGLANKFPSIAFNFILENQKWLEANLEPWAHPKFVPKTFENSYARSMITNLTNYAKAHIPKTAMQSTVKAIANITYNADVREKRLPEISAWLKRQGKEQ